jgi:hypothetical protein
MRQLEVVSNEKTIAIAFLALVLLMTPPLIAFADENEGNDNGKQ